MKKLIVTITALIILMTSDHAAANDSDMKFGVKAGVNLASWSLEDPQGFDQKMKMGFAFGPTLNYKIQDKLFLNVDAVFSQKGATLEKSEGGQTVTNTASATYISVPAAVSYKLMDEKNYTLGANAGVYLGLLMGKIKSETESVVGTTETESDGESLDYGLSFGVDGSFNVADNWINFDIRYELGLADVSKAPENPNAKNTKDTNTNIAILFGYMF